MYLWRNLKPGLLLAVLSPLRGAPGKAADGGAESTSEALPPSGDGAAAPDTPRPTRRSGS